MKTSASILKIAPAFAKAQALFVPPLKDSHADAGKFGYSYADLANVFEGARPGLVPNGLFLFAVVIEKDNGGHALETVLMHESGEYFAMEYPLNMQGTPQVVGSAITYARRYSAMMILGLAGEDDDGAAASKKPNQQPAKTGSSGTTTQGTTTQNPAQPANQGTTDGSSGQSSSDAKPTDQQLAIAFWRKWADKLKALAESNKYPEHQEQFAAVKAVNGIKTDSAPRIILDNANRIMLCVTGATGEMTEPLPAIAE